MSAVIAPVHNIMVISLSCVGRRERVENTTEWIVPFVQFTCTGLIQVIYTSSKAPFAEEILEFMKGAVCVLSRRQMC